MLILAGCGINAEDADRALFERVSSETSNIRFSNDLSYGNSFNIYTYKDFYAGGGVALGDVDGDGLLDVYLVGNQKPNRLYVNRGNFTFEDITETAGVGGSKPWSTGVSMVDINGDDLLDIYVTNAGAPTRSQRENELYINNGDLTFTESAEQFGLNDPGYSIHAAFFDYDRDGDLDLYLLNNYASQPIGQYDQQNIRRESNYFEGGDRFYRNDGGSFAEVTEQAGIYSSRAGFGLGVSVGDLTRNGWMDIYVSNDFFERDYLYLNNGDGTFREVLEEKLGSTSTTSMGGDVADLNNDGFPEIFVTDMLPESEERLKTVTDFIGWDRLQAEIEMGYHRKFTRNTLHYNNGDDTFSEIGRYAGVEATGWSWGALMADFNLDGRRDIFVPNGFYKDVTDKDHLLEMRSEQVMKQVMQNGQVNYEKLVELTPSAPIANYMFENAGNMQFINRAAEWGLDQPGFSHGSAYGDLEGDGDLDLVVNNVNAEAFVYRNRTIEFRPDSVRTAGGWLQLELEGQAPNTYGVGAQVEIVADGRRWYAEQMPQRGFQSSVDPIVHVGLGRQVSSVDTVRVWWPDGRTSIETNIETGRRLVVRQSESGKDAAPAHEPFAPKSAGSGSLLTPVADGLGLDWTHEESDYNDFEASPLLLHMRSTDGPPLCTGDLNGDGRDDLYVGGARDQAGALFVQDAGGRFERTRQSGLEADAGLEDTDCAVFDADGDDVSELYVASGSSEFRFGHENLRDRLYQIDGTGQLVGMENALPDPKDGPKPTGAVRSADVDGDGDEDLFVGTRMGREYGIPVGGYILANDGTGRFEDATDRLAPQLRAPRMKSAGITDAAWADLNADGTPDLIVVGEWMPLTVFFNQNGQLNRSGSPPTGLDHTYGWWQSLTVADLNDDGTQDLIGGNHGLNSRFRASAEEPVEMWVGDFSGNGKTDPIISSFNNGKGPYPVALRQNLIQQIPALKSRYPTFAAYAETPVREIFGGRQMDRAEHYRADQMASVVAWNNGDGSFSVDSLPFRAQLAPMYSILAEDLDGNGQMEILVGGNLHNVQPQAGRYDASYGTVLCRDARGTYRDLSSRESGFFSPGEIRAIGSLENNGRTLVVVARNDAPLQVFQVNNR